MNGTDSTTAKTEQNDSITSGPAMTFEEFCDFIDRIEPAGGATEFLEGMGTQGVEGIKAMTAARRHVYAQGVNDALEHVLGREVSSS